MAKFLSLVFGLIILLVVGMFALVIILWILNLLLFLLKWASLLTIFICLILIVVNFFKNKNVKNVKPFSHFIYVALAALLIFGISGYFQPKLHAYLTEENAESQEVEEESNVAEIKDKAEEKPSKEEVAANKLKEQTQKKEELLRLKKEEEEKKRLAEEAAKKKEEAARLAEEKLKNPISTDFSSFDNPYDQMTDLQKDKYWEEVKGKYVQWTGEVMEVTEDTISIKSETDTIIDDFIAEVAKEQKESLIAINIGDTLTINGQLSSKEGVILSWYLENAEIK